MNLTDLWTRVLLATGALGLVVLSGCDGGGGNSPPLPPGIAVSLSPAASTIKVDQSQQFTATVTGSSNTAVTWSVGGVGCAGAACGTVSNTGLYSAPAIVPVPPTVSVVATAQADTTKTASAALTIGSDVALSVWPSSARVTVSNSRQFLRMLTGSSNAAVSWSVSGAGCGAGNCGSVSAAGNYQAPASIPAGVSTVTVSATSVVDPGKSAQAAVTLQNSSLATLNGSYAFVNRAVGPGTEGTSGGVFVASGGGALAAGVVDRSLPVAVGGKSVDVSFTGTYAIDNNNVGNLIFALPGGSNEWRMAVNASGSKAFMQAYFNPDVRTSTVLYKTDPTQFTNAGVNGTYVFLLDGADIAGTRIANIGRFTANGNGGISNGVLESNEGGTLTSTTFTGTYSVSQNGRAPLTITTPGGTYSFAMYVVNADMVLLTANDDTAVGVPARAGVAYRQVGGPFSVASLSGDYVFDLAGRNSATSAIATVGRFSSDGAGNVTGQLDRNDNYSITLGGSYTATYTVDANGRGTINSAGLGQLVLHLAGPNRALMMEAPNARVQMGTLERQLAAPYATANLTGAFSQGTAPPAALTSMTVTARVTYDGAGTESSTQVHNAPAPCGLASGSTTASYTVSSAGRLHIPDSGGNPLAAGYMVNPGRYLLVLQRASGGACDEVVQVNYAEQ